MKSWSRLIERVRRCLSILSDRDLGIIVAVSGGADSMALLRAILSVRSSTMPVVVAHLNHSLRGAESDGDAAFVREQCSRLNLPFELRTIDVRLLAQESANNLEATARRERYAWFAEVANKHGAIWVATGHNADDQAETLLHRLMRGTGLQGLRGIAPRRPLTPKVNLIRPLLSTTRSEILEALQKIGQSWREDHTNADRSFTRNRIRHELIPHLKEFYNPGISQVLVRLAMQARESAAREEAEAKKLLVATELPRAGNLVILKAASLQASSMGLVRALFRLLWVREDWPRSEIFFEHLERMAQAAVGLIGAIDLPGGYHLSRRGAVVQVGPKEKKRNKRLSSSQ